MNGDSYGFCLDPAERTFRGARLVEDAPSSLARPSIGMAALVISCGLRVLEDARGGGGPLRHLRDRVYRLSFR